MGTATFSRDEVSLELPLVAATQGNNGYDISKLLATTGDTTIDIGFANTASCRSAITFIDGDAGILRYRGYPIEQLAEKATFLEVSHLVLHGELPTKAELEHCSQSVARYHLIDERLKSMFNSMPRKSHPMPVLSAGLNALSTFAQSKWGDAGFERERSTHILMGAVPTLAAYGYKNSVGEPFLYADQAHSYIENFLRMSFGNPTTPYPFDDAVTRALDVLLILHADHEQNCSTSTVRMVGSSGANVYVSVAAGVNALSGPLHGGANQAVLEMLKAIQESGESVTDYVAKVKDNKASTKLMGFGHRIYKNYDPRAAIVKKHADAILKTLVGHDPLLDIAVALEEAALSDPYFQERRLYPNVDFYTGLIYQAMGFPQNMFTVLFALGRLPGWIAHYWEQTTDPSMKINRPRQVYVGETERNYVPIEERG